MSMHSNPEPLTVLLPPPCSHLFCLSILYFSSFFFSLVVFSEPPGSVAYSMHSQPLVL